MDVAMHAGICYIANKLHVYAFLFSFSNLCIIIICVIVFGSCFACDAFFILKRMHEGGKKNNQKTKKKTNKKTNKNKKNNEEKKNNKSDNE